VVAAAAGAVVVPLAVDEAAGDGDGAALGQVLGAGVGLGAEAYARGGAAVALGALLTPVAAVLGFIDAGDVKDANCGGLEQSTKVNAKAVPPGTRHMPDAPAKKKAH